MSRSFHINKKEIEEVKKQKLAYKNQINHLIDIKRMDGELNEKRHIKRKVKKLRNAKKYFQEIDFKNIISETNTNNEIIITEKDEKNVIFPISVEDIRFVINSFRVGELYHVREIKLEFIEIEGESPDDSSWEIVPGIRYSSIKGSYCPNSDKISISGLIVSENNYEFIEHLIFYYKVLFISTIAHEVIHNIDHNSFRLRKGYNNPNKDYGYESIARVMTMDFYLKKIVPYIKEKYTNEYKGFMLWMHKNGIIPLGMENWQPTLTDWLGHDGINELFKNVFNKESRVKRNLDIADGMHLGEKIERANAYIDYILLDIDHNNYEALKLKAHILRHEEYKFNEAEEIYKKLNKIKLEDFGMLSEYAKVLIEQKKYKSAYKILKRIKLNRYEIIDFMQCLWHLRKQDEFNNLVAKLKNNENYTEGISNISLLMFASAIKRDYDKSLYYFVSLKDKRLGYFEKNWVKYIAAKIYVLQNKYDKARPLLTDDKSNDYFAISYKMKRLKDKLLKLEQKKLG